MAAGSADRSPRRVRVFPAAIIASLPYSIAVSKLRPVPSGTGLRRPFLWDRNYSIAVRLPRQRDKFAEPDFALLARAFNWAGRRGPTLQLSVAVLG
jgi:hypothetical protein